MNFCLLFLIHLSFGYISILALHAEVSDHLKEVKNKSSMRTIRNIDFIYLINLDQRPEKYNKSINQLTPFGIYPCRFSAVNGWELSLEELNDVGLVFSLEMQGDFLGTCYHLHGNYQPSHEIIQNYGQTYFCHCLSRGAIGIALSHISILQDAFDAKYNTIWVLEDDIDVKRDPRILSELIEHLDDLVGADNWDVLFTDQDIRDPYGRYVPTFWAGRRPDFLTFSKQNDYGLRQLVSPEFSKIGARSGAHSMIIRRSGIKKLLQFCKAHQIFFPYDMEYVLPPGINLYTVREDIVSNLTKAPSDNGGPTYLNK